MVKPRKYCSKNRWKMAKSPTTGEKRRCSKSDQGNYRPVSLTNIIGETMERIVKEEITRHIEKNNLISDDQHGFKSGRLPETNLIEFLNATTKWTD